MSSRWVRSLRSPFSPARLSCSFSVQGVSPFDPCVFRDSTALFEEIRFSTSCCRDTTCHTHRHWRGRPTGSREIVVWLPFDMFGEIATFSENTNLSNPGHRGINYWKCECQHCSPRVKTCWRPSGGDTFLKIFEAEFSTLWHRSSSKRLMWIISKWRISPKFLNGLWAR